MLDNEIKQRIDGARDVLVGQIPDPKGQVDQITTALVYKFMGDLDRRAEEEGGKRSFFVDGYSRFAWDALMDAKLGGSERRDLYAHAIEEMATNERLPELFRAMFKGTFLPFRDPRILTLFLKEIDMLPYRHSEDLGTAYEYLLSIMGTQGDAGQFRTPRHIIDFIVAVVDPHKGERIHDPACGTAGFLISAFRHIQQANTKDLPGDTLSPSDKRALTQNLIGCELDPGMVRLSLVNMYMHGIRQPQIREYDTLTYDELWDESYDAVLANPPFMTPKGGIHPHGRFAVQAKRSEVLFVDYIAEHLSLRGRAGVIVPEGIIFQSQRAYKELRRRLVEDWGLWAVISLPAGVFNPYSGVKTSILFLDKTAAKGAGEILFVRVSADGFDLGAQRRPVAENDLPQVRKILSAWKRGEKLEGSEMALWTPKEKIAEDDEYNLSAERYRVVVDYSNAKWPMVKLEEVVSEMKAGFACGKSNKDSEGIIHLRPMNLTTSGEFVLENSKYIAEEEAKNRAEYFIEEGDVLFNNTNSKELVGKTCVVNKKIKALYSNHITRIRVDRNKYKPKLLALILYKLWNDDIFLRLCNKWVGQAGINLTTLSEIKIPLPPLAVQEEIVAEVDGYQRVIDGARLAIANWKPTININPDWPKVKLGEVCVFEYGKSLKVENRNGGEYPVFGSNGIVGYHDSFIAEGPFIVIGRKGTAGAVVYSEKSGFPIDTAFYVRVKDKTDIKFLYYILQQAELDKINQQTGIPGLNRNDAYKIMIPSPPLAEQQRIVAEIAEEEKAIAACRHLINSHEQKIRAKIADLWGETPDSPLLA